MVLEFESLSAIWTFEPPQNGGFVVRDHVSLQSVNVGELLLAHLTGLKERRTNHDFVHEIFYLQVLSHAHKVHVHSHRCAAKVRLPSSLQAVNLNLSLRKKAICSKSRQASKQ